jgi:capsular polysaccharide transport system permease protein
MMFTLGVLILWTMFGLHKVALPIVAFTLSGYASIILWRNTINRCGNAVDPNRALMHHRNVRIIDLYAARIILEVAGASISFLILCLFFIAADLIKQPDDLLKIILGWSLLAWFSLNMALIIGALTALSESVDRVWHVISYLFLPISGAFFMVDWMPKSVQEIVVWVPTVNCTELLREGLFGSLVRAHYDLGYITVVNLLLMLTGLILVRYIGKHMEGE